MAPNVARAKLTTLYADNGQEALRNTERTRTTMRGFKIAKSKLGQAILALKQRIAALDSRRAAKPKRVPVEDVVDRQAVKLAPERKLLTNLVKMVAYQAKGTSYVS